MTAIDLPRGSLVRSRVVPGAGAVLAGALERELTGYAVLTSQSALLLEDDDAGVLTFEDGVPVVAYHTGSDAGGREALAAFPAAGPCRADCYALGVDHLAAVHDTPALRVPAGLPADRLAGDPALAERTRERAPAGRGAGTGTGTGTDDEEPDGGALAAFLDDEERIERLREEARAEAERRAAEWELTDELDG